jgi:hypothetical protein
LSASRSSTPARVSLAGTVGFLACTTAAILVYPGGSLEDPNAERYLLLRNFLSDLGGTFTGSGRPNGSSRALFIAAMASVAVSLAALGVAARGWARIRLLGWLPAIVAGTSGMAFVRAATIPWNRDYELHMTWVRAAFGLLGVFVLIVLVLEVAGHAPPRWIALNALFLVALGGYVVFDQQGPAVGTVEGLETRVGAQKAIVLLAITNLTAQAWALSRRRAGAGTRSVQVVRTPRAPPVR